MRTIWDEIREILKKREPAALCTLVEAHGSTPAKEGAKLLVRQDGKTFGTLGGGRLEYEVIQQSIRNLEASPSSWHLSYHLVKDLGMCCGGQVKVFVERIQLPYRLVVFGAGHIGKALAQMASMTRSFEIILVDDRRDYLLESGLPDDVTLIQSPFREYAEKILPDHQTAGIIVTYDHELDRQTLAACLKKSWGFLGMIGSKRKVAVTRKLFLEKGIANPTQLNAVEMPVGLDLGGHTPEEIALSILGRLVQVKNNPQQVIPQQKEMPPLPSPSSPCPLPQFSSNQDPTK